MPGTALLAPSCTDVQHYLDLLFPDVPDDAWLVISWFVPPDRFCSQWFLAGHRDDLMKCIAEHAPTFNVYIGLGARHPQCQPHTDMRGTSDDVCALGGLWVEFDHAAGKHAAHDLPSPQVLKTFLQALPFTFSLIVNSGGGLHAYLLFKELWLLDTPEDRAAAALLLKRFQRSLQMQASAQGWKIDNTADLARVLRPAGTFNHKQGAPQPVGIWQETAARYNPSDLAELLAPWLVEIEDTYVSSPSNGAFPTTLFPLIETGCAWMAHCREDAARLPESEWYAMLGIVGRCDQGEELAQTLSSPYPRYSPRATAKKLQHALDAAGPRTCQGIRYDLNADAYCRDCPSWEKIKSPITLGMPPSAAAEFFDTSVEAPHVGFGSAPGVVPSTTTTKKGSPKKQPAYAQAQWYQDKVLPYVNKQGIVDANDTTICAFLRNHSYWQGKLWWNALSNRPMVDEEVLDDHLLTRIGEYFGEHHKIPIRTTGTKLAKCIAAVCQEQKRDPLQEYLDGLDGWDMVPRLDTWLMDCGGVDDTPYGQFVSRILIVSMIARAYEPGCLYRYVVVFQGPEEYRKSTFVAHMVPNPEWQDTVTESFDSKDIPMLISALWIAELSELDSLVRTQETRLKAFISKKTDSYVPKWGLFRVSPPRRTIFIGTTNEKVFLRHKGETRFLPVSIFHPMDVEAFVEYREQLYAEAKVWYGDHVTDWWRMPPDVDFEAKEQREARRQESVYESTLDAWLHEGRLTDEHLRFAGITPGKDYTTWQEIAVGYLKMDIPERWKDMGLQKQVGAAMKALDWYQTVDKDAKGKSIRVWKYEAPLPF